MLFEQTCLLIGLTTYTLIQTANSLVVLSLNLEDIQKLTSLVRQPDGLLMAMRQGHKQENSDNNKKPRVDETTDDATERSRLRTYKIPSLDENGRSDLEIVYERPSKKIQPVLRAQEYTDRLLNRPTTTIAIPGEVFNSYAKGMSHQRRNSGEIPEKSYHDGPALMETTAIPAPANFGHKSFVSAVQEPDAIHIRQIGNRVISAFASSGRRHGSDLVLRPMEADQMGGRPTAGEVIRRRSMHNIQANVMDSIADPKRYV